jgi:hypothetical protein
LNGDVTFDENKIGYKHLGGKILILEKHYSLYDKTFGNFLHERCQSWQTMLFNEMDQFTCQTFQLTINHCMLLINKHNKDLGLKNLIVDCYSI